MGDDRINDRLEETVIDMAILDLMRKRRKFFDVIIEVNLLYPQGRKAARSKARELLKKELAAGLKANYSKPCGIREMKSCYSSRYLFAHLHAAQIRKLGASQGPHMPRSDKVIYKIWLDEKIRGLLTRSVQTVKADAALAAFSAAGNYVTWAVLDSGINGKHVHFQATRNLKVDAPVRHADFSAVDELNTTGDELDGKEVHTLEPEDVVDPFGHGTHVAGILAGGAGGEGQPVWATRKVRNERNITREKAKALKRGIQGVAPKCRLVSLRVLDENGQGNVSNIIAAIGYIQEINNHGRWLHIHGVNLSVGYEFDAEAYACGQSPLCVAVNRLVRSGVVVVAAAGNTGYGKVAARGFARGFRTSLDVTINDPGNAELAITVGSTHREKPHLYGVSYFSSRGPTADGRLKPDLVAPGERIISAAAKSKQIEGNHCWYREESGTSMAAPHVSGCIAAFLSIRNEFIGEPERVKEIFLSTATDLKRESYFQGHGMIDLMRAIQSV